MGFPTFQSLHWVSFDGDIGMQSSPWSHTKDVLGRKPNDGGLEMRNENNYLLSWTRVNRKDI